jgi:alanyl-tRNA synthetase
MKVKEIREKYLNFFKSKGHQIVSSAPMVVKNDPTLLFANAGMNQFKSFFLGDTKSKYSTVANSQKCLRVSGKHNDLEEVGLDTYHHTMFEMLGNWSFGDYFKKEAIYWSWELLTEVYKLDKSQIYVTVFGGDKNDGLSVDTEAYEIWSELLEKDRILACDKKDNFWEMGAAGPCGPCSEIHIDLRDQSERNEVDGISLVNKDHPQVIEVWNLVFMEYNRKADGSLHPLSEKHIDTGMGLERLAMILQNKKSNYNSDVFSPLIQKVETLSQKNYNSDAALLDPVTVAMRVIVDHIRAIAFSIADGQLPSNTGAGYVIRRILRRAVRYGYQTLNLKEPFLYELVEVLAIQFDGVFPELEKQKEFIEKVVKEEETSFYRTLEQGLKRIDSICSMLKENNKDVVSGKDVFELYDRYGFPIDLTELISKGYGFTIDTDGFNVALNKQKTRSKAAAVSEKSDWIVIQEDDKEEFIGYDFTESDVKITRYREVLEKGKKTYHLVFNFTPFYPEGGGQIGDAGYIDDGENKLSIIDTKKENDLIIHFSKELPKNINASFKAVVNAIKRELIANNHTATHLLHQALREVLGEHVEQKGSLVNDKHLRFDFSHFEKLSKDDIVDIQQLVNNRIRASIQLEEFRNIPLNKAKEEGAMMLFGEKYGEVVRMIKFEDSIELCGGIHVNSTSNIGQFIITNESSIAAGVRRVEAITADAADQYLNNKLAVVDQLADLLKHPKDIYSAVNDLLNKNADLLKTIETSDKEKAVAIKNQLIESMEVINGVSFLAQKVDLNANSVKDICFELKSKVKNLFLVLAFEQKGKVMISVALSDDMISQKKLNAGEIVNELAKEIGGRGGGQPFFATAGGPNSSGINQALTNAKQIIS